MNSSKSNMPFSDFLQENDFLEIAQKARAERTKKEEAARIEAAKPKISEEDVQAAERRGIEQGIEQGKQEALLLLKAEMEENIATMRAKFDELEPIKMELAAKMESDMLALMRHIIRHIGKNLEDKFNQDLLQAALKTALMSIQDGLTIKIHTHPDTQSYLMETTGELLSTWDVQWQKEKELSIGHCLIEWENQGIDLNFKQVTKEIDSLLEGAIAGANHAYQEMHTAQPSEVEATPTPIEKTETLDEPLPIETDENIAEDIENKETPPEADTSL